MSQKIIGVYVPCEANCGQPEPCWGCDSGDYEDPAQRASCCPLRYLKVPDGVSTHTQKNAALASAIPNEGEKS